MEEKLDGTVLLVNLDKKQTEEIEFRLSVKKFKTVASWGYAEALQMVRLYIPDIFIICEDKLDCTKGISLINDLKTNAIFKKSQILYLTRDASETKQIEAFEAGADQVLELPVSEKILLSHINFLIKKFILDDTKSRIDFDKNLILDPESLTVTIYGKRIILVRREFELFYLLSSSPNRIITRTDIFNHIWKGQHLKNDRTLDVHIRKIRLKMGIKNIKTVFGQGYKFVWDNELSQPSGLRY